MIKKIMFWAKNSRLFSLPMTLMSWAVIFAYALKDNGNILSGILALIGIVFAHLAANLFDDYVDYKALSANDEFRENAVKSKCKYIKDGSANLNELLSVVILYCSIAFVIGVILTLRCGFLIIGLAVLGGIITLSYSKLSSVGLSEIAVWTAFGPLLFEGVYYVMCGRFSYEVFILSVAVAAFTTGLLYTHTLLDFDGDVCAHKKTICCCIGDKDIALNLLPCFYGIGYIMCFYLIFLERSRWYIMPVVLTLPLMIILYVLMKMYNRDKNSVPKIEWWHLPLDAWEKIKQEGTQSFYLRLFFARNLMIWFTLLMIISVSASR